MLNNIENISWEQLKDSWLLSIDTYDEIGKPPETTVNDLISNIEDQIYDDNFIVSVEIRKLALRESIYLIHKSCSVLSSLEADLKRGKQTYAEVSGYMSSFFSAKAILILLGLYASELKINKKGWSLYLFSHDSNGDSKIKIKKRKSSQVTHVQIWEAFKDIFSKVSNLPIDHAVHSFLSGLNAEDFSENRNYIQYGNCSWTHADLHNNEILDINWISDFNQNLYLTYTSDDANSFSIILSLISIRLYKSLLSPLAESSASLMSELNLIRNNVSSLKMLKGDSWLI